MAAVTWDVPTLRPVVVDVVEPTSAAALCFIVERSGRSICDRPQPGSWVIADRVDGRRAVDVLVCGPTALDAHAAVAAFAAGVVRAVIGMDEPERILAALAALDVGLSLVPADLLERARAIPTLTPRQHVVLRAVLAGQSNSEIARALQVRPVTIKREVAALFGALGATRRFELMSAGFALGFRAEAARP